MGTLTHDFSETVAERIKSDPVFAQALFDEAITLFVNGEADTAKSILCELAEATIGFEVIGEEIQRPNPTMSSISTIAEALGLKMPNHFDKNRKTLKKDWKVEIYLLEKCIGKDPNISGYHCMYDASLCPPLRSFQHI